MVMTAGINANGMTAVVVNFVVVVLMAKIVGLWSPFFRVCIADQFFVRPFIENHGDIHNTLQSVQNRR